MHFVDGVNTAIEYKYNKNGCTSHTKKMFKKAKLMILAP